MFSKLVGNHIVTNVTLMTTMWADKPTIDAVRREGELKGKYFKEFLQLGATLARFDDSQVSAAVILEPLVALWRAKQDEDRILSIVRSHKRVTYSRVDNAEAFDARVVHGKVHAILERRRDLLDKLAARIEANKDEERHLRETMAEMERLQAELETAQGDADRLNLELANHLKVLIAEMRRTPHPLLSLVRYSFNDFPRL